LWKEDFCNRSISNTSRQEIIQPEQPIQTSFKRITDYTHSFEAYSCLQNKETPVTEQIWRSVRLVDNTICSVIDLHVVAFFRHTTVRVILQYSGTLRSFGQNNQFMNKAGTISVSRFSSPIPLF